MVNNNYPLSLNVRGLRVLVTAGAGGIGRAMAEAFLKGGAKVHITDINQSAVEQCLSDMPELTATIGDAATNKDVERAYDDVINYMDGLDVLVNNAGVAGPTCGVEGLNDEDLAKTIDVNLKGQFYFLTRFTPLLKVSTNNPSVIAISSVAGRMGYSYRSPYAATKWGIVGLTKTLAQELGPDGVRVNAVLPGPVNGERIDRVIADRAIAKGLSFEAMREEFERCTSLRRLVDAEDVAGMALFLASQLARNITGQVISVDANVEYL